MNIQTDIEEVSYLTLERHRHFWTLEEIALKGSEEQRDTLLDWAYFKLPAESYYRLCEAADRAYLIKD